MTIDFPPEPPAIIQPSYNNIRSKTMTELSNIELLTVKEFYNNPQFVCDWQEYKVFAEDYGNDAPAIGLPQFVLYKDGKARLTSTEEAFTIIKTLPDED